MWNRKSCEAQADADSELDAGFEAEADVGTQTLTPASPPGLAGCSLGLRHLDLGLALALALEDGCLAEVEVERTGGFVRSHGHS